MEKLQGEKLHLVSWNVNGWKKTCEIIKKNDTWLSNFLKKLDIDILCLQETKINEAYIENDFNSLDTYSNMYESYWDCCKKKIGEKRYKGYSGLATYVSNKAKIICTTNRAFKKFSFFAPDIEQYELLVERKFPGDGSSISFYLQGDHTSGSIGSANDGYDRGCVDVGDLFAEGRCLVTVHRNFALVNVYAPYSGCNYDRLDYKMMFLHAVRAKLMHLRITTGLPIMLVGDLNISFRNRDVYHLKNVVNLNELLRNIHKINLKEEVKKKICKEIPLIMKTLRNRNNFIIKKRKTERNESYQLFLNFDNNVKKVGGSFSSPEEIFFLFSLDAMYVQDKYVHYPKAFFFTLDSSIREAVNGTVDGTVGGTVDGTVDGMVDGTVDGMVDGTVDGMVDGKVNDECVGEMGKGETPPALSRKDVYAHILQNTHHKVEEALAEGSEHVTYNANLKEKLKEGRRILCKYAFKSCSEGKYLIKRENCLHLHILKDLLLSLHIVLSNNDLLNVANCIGYSSSPQCCTEFIKNLVYEDNMIDTFSFFHPDMNGKFTCWDTYKQCRVDNEGSRIDYIFVDHILYEKFIQRHSHLYESPIVWNEHLRGLLQGSIPGKSLPGFPHLEGSLPTNAHYEWVNSPENNRNYANYFNLVRKKTGRNPSEEIIVPGDDDMEMYSFQFKFLSYIGFIYTSPRMSDHIAVNCTFIMDKEDTKDEKKKKKIPICCSNDTISLRYLCNSEDQYVTCLPMFLINTPLFSQCTYENLTHVHAHNGACYSVMQTQPQRRTNKITNYFTIRKEKAKDDIS
ncbi:exodeoxyribonuclease III, putative [Plasmodium ovale]|uniref:Exodeoxyribonuclease III, putative n=2 Tax=Plasmodium ovale TaxID=36330 RepID=A0A1A8W3E4_PLAOA|nr:exodeoxyribonuclease III, putative [Plasmodium ovale curtisi]SCP06124.1 exodeoxyribonuclease III, putative [Plasmodium ovale]